MGLLIFHSALLSSLPLPWSSTVFHSVWFSRLTKLLCSRVMSPTSLPPRNNRVTKAKGRGQDEKGGMGENRRGARRIEIKRMINEALSSWMWDSVVGQSFAGLLLGKRFMLSAAY